MNLTKNEAVVLGLLTDEREMYGLDVVKKSEGKLKLGTICFVLSGLEEKGFTTSRKKIDPSAVVPRRLYKITGVGLRVHQAWTAAMDAHNSRLYGVDNERKFA
jgi:DNA-binding PadR family transcriptional regulator